jgi:predicted GNAT family acetyltransferase
LFRFASAKEKPVPDRVRNNEAFDRFELDVEGGVAIAKYRLLPGTIAIVHTEVPARLRGSGLGSRLARAVLEEVRRTGLKVVPQCGFMRAFMEKNTEFNDLLG